LSYFDKDGNNENVDVNPGELGTFICEIVKNKEARYKGLREIVLWEKPYGQSTEPDSLERNEGCRGLVEACKAANVRICWHKTGNQPLFGLPR
jgi:hypothetical protein